MAAQDTIALNAGAGLYVAGVAESVASGCEMAKAALLKGAPLETLDRWKQVSGGAA